MLFLDKIFQDILAVAAGPGPLPPGLHPVCGHGVAASMSAILGADQRAEVTGHPSVPSNSGTVWLYRGSSHSGEVGTVSENIVANVMSSEAE